MIDVTDGDRNDGTAAVLLVNWGDGKLVRTLQAKAGGFTERAAFHPKGYVIRSLLLSGRSQCDAILENR